MRCCRLLRENVTNDAILSMSHLYTVVWHNPLLAVNQDLLSSLLFGEMRLYCFVCFLQRYIVLSMFDLTAL